MLMTCGSECDITTDNLYIVAGYLSKDGECFGGHGWLLYKHPTLGWVFVDPTHPEYPHVEDYFMPINKYPCITFGLTNFDVKDLWETPDGLVGDTLCPGYGIDLSTCGMLS